MLSPRKIYLDPEFPMVCLFFVKKHFGKVYNILIELLYSELFFFELLLHVICLEIGLLVSSFEIGTLYNIGYMAARAGCFHGMYECLNLLFMS